MTSPKVLVLFLIVKEIVSRSVSKDDVVHDEIFVELASIRRSWPPSERRAIYWCFYCWIKGFFSFFLLLLRLFLARCCGRRQRHWAGGAVGNKIRVRLFCWRLFFFFSFLFWFVLLDSFLFLFVFFALEPGRNERESAREVRSSSSVWIWCISPAKKKFFLVWKSILWRFFFKWMNEWQRTMSNLFLSIRSHQSIHFNYFFNVSLPIWIH